MLLYIKQKIFSLNDKYDVYDVDMNPVFHVESEFLSLLSKIHIYDIRGEEVYFIKKKFTFMLAEYEIYKNDNLCARINQQFALFRPKLTVSSDHGDFDIDGEIFDMDFSISYNGRLLGTISKKWFTFGDSYELNISSEKDASFFVALAIAIDNCLHNGNNNNH